jgi:hypothetical protein
MVLKIYTNKRNYHIWYRISILLWIILGVSSCIIGFVRNNTYMGYGGIIIVFIAIVYSIYVHYSEKRRDRKLEDIYDNFNRPSSISYEST